jgi:FtsZ-binding cell division protein ZapB
MSKQPSAATALRNLRRDHADASRQVQELRRELEISRGQSTKARQEAAEWKARFDALLARVPVTAMEAK